MEGGKGEMERYRIGLPTYLGQHGMEMEWNEKTMKSEKRVEINEKGA
jgi:hypothetical protein